MNDVVLFYEIITITNVIELVTKAKYYIYILTLNTQEQTSITWWYSLSGRKSVGWDVI